MNIVELNLLAFGPFTDRRLVFDHPGLQIAREHVVSLRVQYQLPVRRLLDGQAG